MNDATNWVVGQPVEVVDNFGGRTAHVCNANVERLTKTLVITRNEHGNQGRYYRETGRMVGYEYPTCTHELRSL